MHLYIRFGLLTTAGLLAIGFVGNQDFADALVMEAMEKQARPARVIEVYREAPLDCPSLNVERQWLRFQVAHKSDRKPWQIHCEYGKAQLIAENL